MDSRIINSFISVWRPLSSCNNLKSAAVISCSPPRYPFIANKSSKTGIPDCGAKGFQFFADAFGNQFHPAIVQIPHGPGHFKPGGRRFRVVTKPYALHAARIKNCHPLPLLHKRLIGHGRDEAKVAGVKQYFY